MRIVRYTIATVLVVAPTAILFPIERFALVKVRIIVSSLSVSPISMSPAKLGETIKKALD